MNDSFDLQRFIEAQQGSYATAIGELEAGHKRSHWMWWIFPQLAGLGTSQNAHIYGLSGMSEARAYLAHSLLRQRLAEATSIMMRHAGARPYTILGTPDDLKFWASMTLFDAAEPASLWGDALRQFFDRKQHPQTIEILLRG